MITRGRHATTEGAHCYPRHHTKSSLTAAPRRSDRGRPNCSAEGHRCRLPRCPSSHHSETTTVSSPPRNPGFTSNSASFVAAVPQGRERSP